jgi:hypothetical protein
MVHGKNINISVPNFTTIFLYLSRCSLDASLFNNFQTNDGDLLVAKFRAFKFPDTTYVMFIGTVTVCLDKCPGVSSPFGCLRPKKGTFEHTKTHSPYIHTYHSHFIPEGAADASQIFLRDTHVLPKLVSYEEHCRRDRW